MIVVDSSALVAICLGEPEHQAFLDTIGRQPAVLISAVNLMETRMVLYSRAATNIIDLDIVLAKGAFQVEAASAAHGDLAFDAFRRFGRGSGHRANLNFGDCFAYALARERDLPLLFKGDDFIHTDICPA